MGAALDLGDLTALVADYVKRAGFNKPGSCHLMRHTMATVMLEHGADTRIIQEILGHASLETTQVYTHLSIQSLKKVHAATHPAQPAPHAALR
jgi:integrase/recombinase XerD